MTNLKRQSEDAPNLELRASNLASLKAGSLIPWSHPLARPAPEDYWPILGVKLVVASTAAALSIGLCFLAYSSLDAWFTRPLSAQDISRLMAGVFASFIGACVVGGYTTIACLLVMPVASWCSAKSLVPRPGRITASIVTMAVLAPLWMLSIGRQGFEPLPLLLVSGVPFAAALQCGGLLAAPADVLRQNAARHTGHGRRFMIGHLLAVITFGSIAAALGSMSPYVLGLVLLLGTLLATHIITRRPLTACCAWLLSRRFVRRRHQRRQVGRST